MDTCTEHEVRQRAPHCPIRSHMRYALLDICLLLRPCLRLDFGLGIAAAHLKDTCWPDRVVATVGGVSIIRAWESGAPRMDSVTSALFRVTSVLSVLLAIRFMWYVY